MKLNQYLQKAQKEKWALGQFNFSSLEIFKAIIKAAEEKNSPLILGTSEGESSFFGLREAGAMVEIAREKGLPLFLNLDHGHSLDYLKEAVKAGYQAIHFDGSDLPLEKNIEIAKKVVAFARSKGVTVEGEINFVKGSSQVLKKSPNLKEQDLTDPEEARKFVEETGVDSLAVNIGTFHGVDFSGKSPNINLTRLQEIRESTDDVFLVLHGGSGVDQEQIKEAVRQGIVKININTELRMAYTSALNKSLKGHPDTVKPYHILPSVIEAVKEVVKNKIDLFGSQNKI